MKIRWLILAVTLSGCTVYESDGRKYLESNAYSCCAAGLHADTPTAQKILLRCDHSTQSESWQLSEKTQLAEVYRNGLDLRVRPFNDTQFNCDFHFADESDLESKTASAIDLTILQVVGNSHGS